MPDYIKAELQKFSITDAAIAILASSYMPMKVKGLDDKEGLRNVHEGRMIVKAKRIEVEKKRKELKESSLSFGRAVDGEAKRITALLLPIEAHLGNEESIIEKEKERLALEAVQKRQAKLQERANKMKAYECTIDAVTLSTLPDDVFEKTLANAEHDYKMKQQKQKEEAEEIAKTKAAQEQERMRLETIAKQQTDNEARIRIEAKKIEDERLAKETRLAIEKEKKEREDSKERLKTDYEKLFSLAAALACIEMPTVTSKEAKAIIVEVESRIEDLCNFLADNIN